MKFVDAKKLHDEDEVIVKKTGCVLHVLGDVEVDGKDVFIPCDDGKLYHHTAVKLVRQVPHRYIFCAGSGSKCRLAWD